MSMCWSIDGKPWILSVCPSRCTLWSAVMMNLHAPRRTSGVTTLRPMVAMPVGRSTMNP